MITLPGWTTKIDEISNGIFKVTLTDSFGRKAEIIDKATDDTIQRTYQDAFKIEKEVSTNWNKFLYDLCLSQLSDITITCNNYNDKTFGSWMIQIDNKRLIYLGKENWLVPQTQKNDKWFDQVILKKEELTYSVLIIVIRQIRSRFRTK